MNKNKITQNQYMYIIFSSMIGVGLFSLASSLCGKAYQSAWITVIIGSLYPFLVIGFSSYIERKTNEPNFNTISTKLYGKVLTIIFSLVFFLFLLFIYVTVISGFTNVLKLTVVEYLEPIYVIIPTLLLTMIISRNGINIVGRICELYFFITLPLLVIPLILLFKGTIVNILPVKISLAEVIKAVPESFYVYTGCEVSYFVIDKISNKKSVLKPGLIAVFIICLVYTLSVFLVTYYLGWEVTSKLEYPLLYAMHSVDIPLVSNFVSIVIFLWGAIILRLLVLYGYTCSSILAETFKLEHKKACLVFAIIAFICTFFLVPEYNRKGIIGIILPYFVGFSVIWGIITSIIVMIKYRGEKLSKKS